MAQSTPPLLQFEPYLTSFDASFWQRLTDLKLDRFKLNDQAVAIRASYLAGRQVSVGSAGTLQALPATLRFSDNAFDVPQPQNPNTPAVRAHLPLGGTWSGQLFNTNTVEEFARVGRPELLRAAAQSIWASIVSGEAWQQPQTLQSLVVVSFADLKKYRYYYRCAIPALPSLGPPRLEMVQPLAQSRHHGLVWAKALRTAVLETFPGPDPYFVVVRAAESDAPPTVYPLAEYPRLVETADPQTTQVGIGFIDTSGLTGHPGWSLRNLLLLLQFFHSRQPPALRSGNGPADCVIIPLIALRNPSHPSPSADSTTATSSTKDDSRDPSLYLEVQLPLLAGMREYRPPAATQGTPDSVEWPSFLGKPVGWEKHPEGKAGPRMVDLAASMDPRHLATTAMDLNLKLMKWRVAPQLDLSVLQNKKCLLFGAGTLGTYVARGLLAWGIRHITFVDNGRVSFSNPVRQSLYEFSDCLDGGSWKAAAAAAHLRRIYPNVISEGHALTIPMPGHPIATSARTRQATELAKLEALVHSHDVLFLLTDSRESRWLPTLWGNLHQKITINAALGFDGYLVMRHGVPTTPGPTTATASTEQLGCYFCNDVVAPTDSLSDRSLDQQCTVTRPGLALMAGALAVELLVTILQHPLGASAPPPQTPGRPEGDGRAVDPPAWMGAPPHQIRGFLTGFQQRLIVGQAYDKCTACSHSVLEAYHEGGVEFLWKVFDNHRPDSVEPSPEYSYLESVTGLDELKRQTEQLLASLELADEAEGGSDDDFLTT
ncbi:Autophagy protein 7 [Dimargaris cristalligena]|nr:Autophagy protein 7 [Dimargaris cristalligena]